KPLHKLLRSASCANPVLLARAPWHGRSLARLACEPSSARLALMYSARTLRFLRAVFAQPAFARYAYSAVPTSPMSVGTHRRPSTPGSATDARRALSRRVSH